MEDEIEPLIEDDLRWKTNIDGRLPSMGETAFGGRLPVLEDTLMEDYF